MASYHLSVKAISRSEGRSAVAAAAYRSAELIYCEREGRSHDYTRKSGVLHLEIVAPDHAPAWVHDRAALWNHVEAAEKRKNAMTVREWEIALPSDLNAEERKQLALSFASDLVEKYGVVADVAIHAPHRDGDQRNHHAHILTSTRRIEAEGFTTKTRELDDRKTGRQHVTAMREHWADLQNAALEQSGSMDRVDHRSLEAQREEAEQERDRLQARVVELESVIDGFSFELVEPTQNQRRNMLKRDVTNMEWEEAERAEWERRTLEQQLHYRTLRAAELDREPQAKLGPAASAMERKARQKALERSYEYEPVTERGQRVQDAQQQLSLVEETKVRFTVARTTYSEARELGFSRMRSAYEAAREALLFGIEPTGKTQDRTSERKARGVRRNPEYTSERAARQQPSVWDALDDIGSERREFREQSTPNEAIQRVQELSNEHQRNREKEAAELERQRLKHEERERDLDHGLGYGL